MKLLHYGKDGGKDSTVWGWWLIEWKRVFSVALLCFENGSREAYHSHAFDSVSWVLTGKLDEQVLNGMHSKNVSVIDGSVTRKTHSPSWRPVITRRWTMHKVTSIGRTWVLTFRGPWADTWQEYLPADNRFVTLTNGRQEVA